jgi:hypothetical protein
MVFERFFNYFEEGATCPPPPPPTNEQLISESAALMKSAGIRTCENSQESATFEGKMDLFLASASMSATYNKSSSIGCEQVAVITDKYRKAVNTTTCLLKETKNVVKNVVSGINSIKFEAGRDLDVNCNGQDGLSIRQGMTLEMISQITLSQTELAKIETACKDVVKTIAESATSSESGLGATPQGSKLIKDTLTDIEQTDYKASISKTLNETLNSMNGSNEILFTAGRDLRISGSRCKFEQDMIIKMVAASTIDSTLSDMMSNLSDTLNDTSVKSTADAKSRGADDLAAAVFTPQGMSKNTMIAVVAVVAVIIIGGIIGVVMMNKSESQPQYAQPQYPQPQYAQSQYSQPPQPYPQYPPAGRVKGSSYSPLMKHDINPKYIFVAILLAIIYFSKKRENYSEQVYNF